MKKPHAGFWLATLGLGVCWLLALLTRDRLNGILLAGAALALILPRRPPQRRGPAALGGIGMDGLWSYSGVLHYSGQHGLPLWAIALWIGFGCWWYWLLDVVRAAPAAGGAGRRRRPLRLRRVPKLDALLPGVPPEFMLLLLAVGWSIYLPAVSWLQWKQRDS